MSSVDLHWSVLGLLSVAIAIAAPGLLVGGVVGALAWPTRRVAGAALGGAVGAAIGVPLVMMLFGIRLPMGF